MFESISSMAHRCRTFLSLISRPIFFMTTLINHRSYHCVLLGNLLFAIFWPTSFIFSVVLSLFYLFRYRNWAVWRSIWCHYLDISILFSNFGVHWRSHSRRKSCQVGYNVHSSSKLPIWNIRTPLSVTCNFCLWKGALSHNFIIFCLLLTNTFCFLRCNESFLFCATSE